MTIYTIYQAIHAQIREGYPAQRHPAQSAYLLDLYGFQPEPTPALEAAVLRALQTIRDTVASHPHLPETEVEAIGLQTYLGDFSAALASDAEGAFSDATKPQF